MGGAELYRTKDGCFRSVIGPYKSHLRSTTAFFIFNSTSSETVVIALLCQNHAPDTTKSTRRSSRKVLEDEDLELKRIRGEISCAECRRLKLRCDKRVPCSSCVRRGCSSICPNGSLSSGQGTRFILADTEHLHRKIEEMSKRIRQLEDALAIFQATVSSDRHPLLQDDLLKIKFGPEAHELSEPLAPDSKASDLVDVLGTLTVGDSGEVQYFGRSAGSETLLLKADEEQEVVSTDEDDNDLLSPDVVKLANLFPFTSKNAPLGNRMHILESLLPSQDRAWSLCQCFVDHASWFFRPFDREELMHDLLPSIYKTAQARASLSTDPDADCPHGLASLFFVFAIGVLVDLTKAPYNAEAEYFYELGRAALSLRPVFHSPQIETVKAVSLMGVYHGLASKNYSRDTAWSIISLASKLAQSVGLHRDSSRWNLDPKSVQRRRMLFWEIFTADMSNCLALGRPPSIHPSYVDCEFPLDEESSLNDAGETQPGFWWWKHTFARDIYFPVIEGILTAKAPSYTKMLDLDRKVRQTTFPTTFKPYARPGDKDYNSPSLSIRSYYLSQHRTLHAAMLYIHRSFFVQALLDHPMNPLRSPFAPSFLAAYRCASIIIRAFAHQYERAPELTVRLWFLINHTFSAAIIVGSVVSRAPNSSMAPSALNELAVAVDIFEKMAIHSRRARIALRVLYKLRDKANQSYTNFRAGVPPPAVPAPVDAKPGETQDDLAIFGGQARVVASRPRRHPTTDRDTGNSPSLSTSSASPEASSSVTPERWSPPASASTFTDIHPSLMQYLDILPGTAPPTPPTYIQPPENASYSWIDIMQESPVSLYPPLQAGPTPGAGYRQPPNLSTAGHVPTADYSNFFGGAQNEPTTDMLDIGLTSESGIDTQWLSFMRECGILDNSFNFNGASMG